MLITCSEVAKYFIWLANSKFGSQFELCPMKLQKVTFFAQGWYLALYGKPLFQDDFQAWENGPVNKILYNDYKIFRKQHINLVLPEPNLPEEIKFFLTGIANTFFPLKAPVLSGITHKAGSPWTLTRNGLSPKDHSDKIISKSLIKEYYQSLIDDTQDNEGLDSVLAQFLDFLAEDAKNNFDQLIPYTENMLEEDRYLLKGVIDL
jgi:uncharacterized phage-associated protein